MARPIGSKNKKVEEFKATEVLNSVSGVTLENVSNKLTAVQVEVQQTLADLSTKLTQQLAVLDNVGHAIVLKNEQLKQLYGIEAIATTMDDLTAQIEAQREAWAKEQLAAQQKADDAALARQQKWAREEESYKYLTEQEHRKIQDTFSNKMAQLDKENKDKQEQLVKSWNTREAELKAREQELADLRTQVSNFPATLQTEMNRAANVTKQQVASDYETRIKITAAENATDKKLALQEIASLNKVISDLQNQNAAMKHELAEANKSIKEISAKALESAASRETVANLQKAFESVQTGKVK